MNKFLEKQIDYILNRLEKAGANKDTEWTVNLSVYDDDALRVLRPNEVWKNGADEHRKMMGYVSAVFLKKNFTLLIKCGAKDFLRCPQSL